MESEKNVDDSNISSTNTYSIKFKEELNNILDNLEISGNGELINKDHLLINFIQKKKLENSRVKYSYIKSHIEWKEYRKDEEDIYLFKIVKKISPNIKKLIINEFKIHKENEELHNICPQFICYYFSNFFNRKKNIYFSKKELLLSLCQTINNLDFGDKVYICPFISPSNLLYIESSGKEFFCLSEIFLVSEPDKEIEIELNITSEWLVPEFQTKKAQINFSSNICCLGYLFYKVLFNQNPFKDEKERKEKKCPNIKEDYKYKELIENCIKINYKERWPTIEDINNYIEENIFEEKEDNSNDQKNIDNYNNSNQCYNKITENQNNNNLININNEENIKIEIQKDMKIFENKQNQLDINALNIIKNNDEEVLKTKTEEIKENKVDSKNKLLNDGGEKSELSLNNQIMT